MSQELEASMEPQAGTASTNPTQSISTNDTTMALNTSTSISPHDPIFHANHTAATSNTTIAVNNNHRDNTPSSVAPNASDTKIPLNPVVGPTKQLPQTTEQKSTIEPSPPEPMIQSSSNLDEQLYQFLTKLSTVKSTVPPTLTRRIMHRQGVGFVDPLVPKLISSCGDKFIAMILSQAIICRDRRVRGELMKRKYERELSRIAKRRKIQEMYLERDLKKKEEILDEFIKKKNSSEEAQETKKKKKAAVHFTFDSEKVDEKDDNDDDDLKQEEEYYASRLKAILEMDGRSIEEPDVHLIDGKKPYMEDESDEEDDEDEDNEREMIQLVDVFRPLQAWGMSLVGKMGLASDPVINNQKKKKDALDEEEEDVSDDENVGDLEEDEEETSAVEGHEKTPARKKKKMAASGEKGGAKRKRSITPKPKSSPSSSGPAVKKTKVSSEKVVPNIGTDAKGS